MSDLINRDALKKELNSRVFQGDYTTTLLLSSFNDLIDNAPTVEAFTKEDMAGAYNEGYMCGNKEAEKARTQGEWIFVFDDKVNNRFIYKCSECGRQVSVYSSEALIPVYPFCHCGAKMKGGAENE